jgi:hypothetical protein
MKKKIFACFCSMVLIFGIGRYVHATSYTFDMGGGSWVDTSDTNDVLQMYATVNPDLKDIQFSLNVGETSDSFYFAKIGTNETWINDDDIIPGTVTAYVDFDNPDLTQAVGGTSVGFTGCLLFDQGWRLIWDDPVYVGSPDSLYFSIDLTDVSYHSGWWQGPDGSACVKAKVTLLNNPGDPPNSVPDAGILWLLGPAFIALGWLGRKKAKEYL